MGKGKGVNGRLVLREGSEEQHRPQGETALVGNAALQVTPDFPSSLSPTPIFSSLSPTFGSLGYACLLTWKWVRSGTIPGGSTLKV